MNSRTTVCLCNTHFSNRNEEKSTDDYVIIKKKNRDSLMEE